MRRNNLNICAFKNPPTVGMNSGQLAGKTHCTKKKQKKRACSLCGLCFQITMGELKKDGRTTALHKPVPVPVQSLAPSFFFFLCASCGTYLLVFVLGLPAARHPRRGDIARDDRDLVQWHVHPSGGKEQKTLTHALPVLLPEQRAWWSRLRLLSLRETRRSATRQRRSHFKDIYN